jgi:hypothetical protein
LWKLFPLRKINLFFVLAICWLIISTILLIIPGNEFPKENWLDKIWFDKWVHIGMFFIMVALWCRALKGTGEKSSQLNKMFVIISLAGLAYGTGMEFVQRDLVVNRSFDIGDIIADGIGCGIGLLYSRRRYIKN